MFFSFENCPVIVYHLDVSHIILNACFSQCNPILCVKSHSSLFPDMESQLWTVGLTTTTYLTFHQQSYVHGAPSSFSA